MSDTPCDTASEMLLSSVGVPSNRYFTVGLEGLGVVLVAGSMKSLSL